MAPISLIGIENVFQQLITHDRQNFMAWQQKSLSVCHIQSYAWMTRFSLAATANAKLLYVGCRKPCACRNAWFHFEGQSQEVQQMTP